MSDETAEATTDEQTTQQELTEQSEQEGWVVPGRYRTVDDVVKALQEADKLHGRQSQEIGELRRQLEELQGQVTRPSQVYSQEAPEIQLTPQEERYVERKAKRWEELGYDADVARQYAIEEVEELRGYVQQHVAPLQSVVTEAVQSSYSSVAQDAARQVAAAGLSAAELEAKLRETYPQELWAVATPQQRREAAVGLAKIIAYDKMAGVQNVSGAPVPSAPAPSAQAPTRPAAVEGEADLVALYRELFPSLSEESARAAAQRYLTKEKQRASR